MMMMMVFEISSNSIDDICSPHMYSIEEIVFRDNSMMMMRRTETLRYFQLNVCNIIGYC